MYSILNITRYEIKSKSLSPWVKFLWHMEASNADVRNKLLPTDCIDVILNMEDDMVYVTEAEQITAPPFHINGLRSKHSYLHQENNICIYGISFFPFGLYPFVHKSLQSLQDEVVDLYEFSNSLAKRLKKAVNCDTKENIIVDIENALLEELSVDEDFIQKAQLISEFMNIEDNASVKSYCEEHAINIKTFERMFVNYTGYTPKVLSSIRRFQNASNQLANHQFVDLTEIAYDNCYTDQSHFIKDFARFSGAVPRTFQSEKITVKENVKYTYQ